MKNCLICNQELSRKPKEGFSRFEKRILCGKSCRQKYITKLRHSSFKIKNCKQCNSLISRRESRLKFCSNKCRIEWNKGSNNPAWKGGVKTHGEYLQVLVGKDHPFSDFHGYIFQHRLVFEQYAKNNNLIKYLVTVKGEKYLNPIIKIHHKNHNKKDNRIENLHPMFTQKEHFHFNWCPFCPHCNKSEEMLENPKG